MYHLPAKNVLVTAEVCEWSRHTETIFCPGRDRLLNWQFSRQTTKPPSTPLDSKSCLALLVALHWTAHRTARHGNGLLFGQLTSKIMWESGN